MTADEFAADIANRARWATNHNDGEPKSAWSTGEQLAVALVLDNDGFLADAGYTRQQARSRLAGDLLGGDVDAWIAGVRADLQAQAPTPEKNERGKQA